MQLCRFCLRDDVETIRSGLFHDQRVYETDGQNALGLHELSKVILLPPVAFIPAAKFFDVGPDGELIYSYRNAAILMGPLAEYDLPSTSKFLDIEARVGVVLKDQGEQIEVSEAAEFILGYTLVLSFRAEDLYQKNPKSALWHDFPIAIGPFITTPEDISISRDGRFESEYRIAVNGEEIQSGRHQHAPFTEFVSAGSQGIPALATELIVGPAVDFGGLRNSSLNRPLRPGDSIQFSCGPIGILTIKVV